MSKHVMQDMDVNWLSLKKDLNEGIVNQFLRILSANFSSIDYKVGFAYVIEAQKMVDSNSLKSYKESYNILFAPIHSGSEWSVIIKKIVNLQSSACQKN